LNWQSLSEIKNNIDNDNLKDGDDDADANQEYHS